MIYGSITNCTVVGHGVRSEWECRLGYQIISENTATNTREIKLQLEARTIHSKYTAVGNQLTPTIDGVPLNTIGMNFSTSNVNVWQVLGTRTITITGAFNGIKTGSFTTNLTGDWGLKSGSASVTINLANLHTSPVVTKVTMQEKNSLVNSYAGIVQFLSSKTITFTTTTYENATISSYQVYHNGVLIGSSTTNGMTIDFDKVGTLITFPMNNKTYCTLRFVVIDSYGTSGYLESQYEVIPYVKPNLVQTSSSVKRNGQLTGKVKLNLVGSFYNQKVNNVANTIKLEFTYWKKGEIEHSTYYTIPFILNGNSLNISNWSVAINNQEVTDIDKNYAYNFKIRATDKFNKQSEITLLCPVGEYLWAEFKDRVDFKDITVKNQNPFLYSTKETRIGSLEDGTSIYRKIYEGTISSTDKEILQSNIINMDVLDFSKGKVNNQSGTQLGLGYNMEGYGSQLYLYNNELTLAHTSDIVGKYRIILDYAKTRGYLVKGNSYQETTKGYQVLNLPDKTTTNYGITTTTKDGIITLNGTFTETQAKGVYIVGSNLPNFKAGETYTLKVYGLTNTKVYVQMNYYNGTTYKMLMNRGNDKARVYTIPDDFVEADSFFIGILPTENSINQTLKIMLVKGEYTDETMPDFEKFTYGASPNPQYPQNIEVVENVEIANLGGNYFDISKVITNTYVINNNDETLTIKIPSDSTTYPAGRPNTLKDYCPNLKVGDTVYLNATSTGTHKRIYLLKSVYTWVFGSARTITQDDLDSAVYWYASGVNTTATISDIMISKENNGIYKPYQQMKATIDLKGNFIGKIGDIQDYLLIHKNKYWLVKNVGRGVISLTGTYETDTLMWYFFKKPTDSIDYQYYTTNGFSEVCIFVTAKPILFSGAGDKLLYAIVYNKSKIETIPTIEELKALVDGKYFYYQLAQPQLIELGELPEEVEVSDDVQLISNLDTTIEITDNFDFDTY